MRNTEEIINTLREIYDPDLNKDIVSLGFIKDVKVDSKKAYIKIELTTPACPVRDKIKDEAIEKIKKLGFDEVQVEMTAQVSKHINQQKDLLLPNVKNTIAIASGKGGVGKSTVAVNIAVSLALDGAEVGLIDADVYGPNVPIMLGANEKPTLTPDGKKIEPVEKYGVKLISIGLLLDDPDTALIWRGPIASGAIKQFMTDVEWGELDYLIFDLPPGTGDIQLTLVQTIPLTGAVIVTTPQDVALADVRKAIKMFQKVNVPILGIIENMSYFICPHCGQRDDIFDHGGGKKASEKFNVPFLGEIPINTRIRISGDSGKPVPVAYPDTEEAKIIKEISRKLAARISIVNFKQQAMPKIEIKL
ncbi:iron-sulfur cluster carrier protein ApbC [Candidatus Kryptobacter tengchongensis]|uniref:Iron-sulfur cluster carrier protein n=1 Tax=Kryptobacter tengchongensis TaxID=1643429 RepID=A0A916LKE5_KRYT1|nr:iron-sulfur cluster carrier protein ApbC [Candidatus Kryptobacter tengchongensis]CUT04247.1 ATP-binding protein involved in chromosome partitioning [Candidatus Kryptobacter tengchongensis]